MWSSSNQRGKAKTPARNRSPGISGTQMLVCRAAQCTAEAQQLHSVRERNHSASHLAICNKTLLVSSQDKLKFGRLQF